MIVAFSILSTLGLNGCNKEDTSNTKLTNGSTRTPPEATDPGWVLGSAQSCSNVSTDPSYTDASAQFGYVGEEFRIYSTEGALGLQQQNEDWWMWQLSATGVQAWNQRAESYFIESASIPVRLYVLDIDENGEEDLLILGEFLEVVWSVQTPSERTEILMDVQHSRGVRDVGLIDIDGDGDQDLWSLVGVAPIENTEAWGLIYEQTAPGEFAEPYEFIDREYFGAPFDGLVYDWEGDGDPDLYICNDFGFMWGGNSVLINEGKTVSC